jgi:rfaE bifunctional protein nucleotidyltransferase chain/domain
MNAFHRIAHKIHDWQSLPAVVQAWRDVGKRIVFTNGCFDLLHYGHIHYLAEASDLGDRLVVGLNSGASVKRLKGASRPINDELTRGHLMAALACVDAVVFFEQDTPLDLIQLVQPDVLVKGGDWLPEQIVGYDWVHQRGGRVLSLPFINGYSTTNIERRIRSGEGNNSGS